LKYKPALTIKKCPEETLVAFKQIAEEKFDGHYGSALTWLLDIAGIMININERLTKVEQQLDTPQEEIKTLGGKVIK